MTAPRVAGFGRATAVAAIVGAIAMAGIPAALGGTVTSGGGSPMWIGPPLSIDHGGTGATIPPSSGVVGGIDMLLGGPARFSCGLPPLPSMVPPIPSDIIVLEVITCTTPLPTFHGGVVIVPGDDTRAPAGSRARGSIDIGPGARLVGCANWQVDSFFDVFSVLLAPDGPRPGALIVDGLTQPALRCVNLPLDTALIAAADARPLPSDSGNSAVACPAAEQFDALAEQFDSAGQPRSAEAFRALAEMMRRHGCTEPVDGGGTLDPDPAGGPGGFGGLGVFGGS